MNTLIWLARSAVFARRNHNLDRLFEAILLSPVIHKVKPRRCCTGPFIRLLMRIVAPLFDRAMTLLLRYLHVEPVSRDVEVL